AAAGPVTMRTPREAATSRAQGVTMAPGVAETSPPGGTAWTSCAVTTSLKRRMVARGSEAASCALAPRPLDGGEGVEPPLAPHVVVVRGPAAAQARHVDRAVVEDPPGLADVAGERRHRRPQQRHRARHV